MRRPSPARGFSPASPPAAHRFWPADLPQGGGAGAQLPTPAPRTCGRRASRRPAPGAPVPPSSASDARAGPGLPGDRRPAAGPPLAGGRIGRVLEAINALSACLTPSPIPSRLAGRAPAGGPSSAGRAPPRTTATACARTDPWSWRTWSPSSGWSAPPLRRGRRDPAAPRPAGGQPAPHGRPGAGGGLAPRPPRRPLAGRRLLRPQRDHAGRSAPGGHPGPGAAATGAEPEAITAAVAVVPAFTSAVPSSPAPGLPTLRAFQRAREVARAWLARRTAWPARRLDWRAGLTGSPPPRQPAGGKRVSGASAGVEVGWAWPPRPPSGRAGPGGLRPTPGGRPGDPSTPAAPAPGWPAAPPPGSRARLRCW